jgi:uncharacterized membrane protein
VGPALCAIALFATVVSQALIEMRWVMDSLFIGLTFGGVPVLWKVLRPANAAAWIGAAVGTAGMIAITWLQSDAVSTEGVTGAWMLLFGGAAGAAAMILPGISGAYLLMLLGQYRPILDTIREGTAALAAGDFQGVWAAGVFLLPVALGVGLGLVAASNVLRWLLRRFEKPTLGVLLGLLIGAPAGLYPFKEGVSPNAPYRHFASKDALLASVAEEGFRRLTAVTAAAKGSPPTRLRQMAVAYVRFATEHPRLYGLMFGPVLTGWEQYPGLVAAGDASFRVLVDAVAHGTNANAKHAAREAILAWSAVHGYAMLAIDSHLTSCPAKQLPPPEELVRIIAVR